MFFSTLPHTIYINFKMKCCPKRLRQYFLDYTQLFYDLFHLLGIKHFDELKGDRYMAIKATFKQN
jgi:hypothetical protein